MKFFVYLICAQKKENLFVSYVGYTNNLQKRLKAHNSSKGAKFTRGKKWKLIYKKKFVSKKDAMKYEYVLKKNRKNRILLRDKFLKNEIIKNNTHN